MISPDTLRLERELPGPIDRVWSYLTDSEKRVTWLASCPIELRVGGQVRLEFLHSNFTDEPVPDRWKEFEEGSTSHGKVLECEPPRLLTFTWSEAHGESAVTFELTPVGTNVKLTLTHRRLPQGDELTSIASGWTVHIGILEDRLHGVDPRPFWSEHTRYEREYAERLAAG
jgi:uncharacterized protein YndB with AHSA1/START domain